MTRRLLTLIFTALMLAMAPAVAQNLKFDIVKFELNQLDGTASNKNYEKIDGSGNKYAIIKVRSTDGDEGLSEFMFNFNSLKSIVEDKGDELWVYVQKNAKIVTISREGYTPLRNFDLKMTLQAGKTYNMEITYDRVEKIVKKELRMQMVCFKVSPAVEGAVVMCKEQGTGNETLIGQTNKQGMVSKNMNFGRYEYKILANNYFATEGIITLNNAKEVYTENITLKSNFSTITLTTNTGAEIYVNNELKGVSSWTGPLQAGDYVVECKQEGHRPTSQSITVEVNADKKIELQKPTPITGVVSVISDPLGATVLIDGKERGKTPCNVSDVLVGNRRVALSMSGYATASTSIVVKEGEVADVNLTLKNTATSTFTTTTQKQGDPKLEEIFQKGLKAYNQKSYDIAVKHFTKAAEQGHSDAQYKLGWCYQLGQGVEKNQIEAFKWWKKAAEQGDAQAQLNLGICYERGEGVEKDLTEAVKWYRKAAEQGNEYAKTALERLGATTTTSENGEENKKVDGGEISATTTNNTTTDNTTTKATTSQKPVDPELEKIFQKGLKEYNRKSYDIAVKHFTKAAEQGHSDAQFYLGDCYFNGEGVGLTSIPARRSEALRWFKKAVEQGNVAAQCALGFCYFRGYGVEKNLTEAVKWFKKAAEQGYARAQCNLGDCYAYGNGVDQNNTEAARWYKKAAEQGHADAQCGLGICYKYGKGVTKDKAEAIKWLSKAAEQGNSRAVYQLDNYK